ncbi:hypothetical protein ACFLXV_04335, partial [Chloroflexota bacterium]
SASTQDAVVSPAVPGIYTLTVVDSSGCNDTDQTTVVVNTLPEATADNNGPVCDGGNVTLLGGPGNMTSYSWTGPGFSASTMNAVVDPAVAGTYTLTVRDGNRCEDTANTTVVVYTPPVAEANNTGPVCDGGNVTLLGGPANMTSYSWTGPSLFSASDMNASVDPAVAGLYTLTVTDSNGCTDSANTTVELNTLPEASAENSGPVCEGGNATLYGYPGGMASYGWTGPGNYTSSVRNPLLSPAEAGLYELTVVDQNGCSDVANTTVVINEQPVAGANNTGPACEGSDIQLNGNATGGTPGYDYEWSGPGGFSSSSYHPTLPHVNAGDAGVYILTVTDSKGCKDTANTTVVVWEPPEAKANNTGPACEGFDIHLGGNATDGTPPYSYSWTGPHGYTSSDQNPVLGNVTYLDDDGEYELTVTDDNGCTDTARTDVHVYEGPEADAWNDGPECEGFDIQLTGYRYDGTSPYTYSWTGPGNYTSSLLEPLLGNVTAADAGLYIFTVTDDNGCADSANTTVVVNTPPVAEANNTGPVCQGGNITLLGGPGNMTSYSWTGPAGFTSPLQNPTILNAAAANAGTYTLTVRGGERCEDTANTTVVVYTPPTATASNNGPVCPGGNVTLTGGPGNMTSYSWTGPGNYTSSEQTIKNHVSAMLRKLNANDRAHAVFIAIRNGMISIQLDQNGNARAESAVSPGQR